MHTFLRPSIRAVEGFAAGDFSFVAVFGPTGWGKSHLLHCAERVLRDGSRGTVSCLSAREWLDRRPSRSDADVLILDEVKDAARTLRNRSQLRQALDLRVRLRRPTLLSLDSSPNGQYCRDLLSAKRLWRTAAIVEPRVRERHQIVENMANAQGIQIHSGIVGLLARKHVGNGRSIGGAIHNLKLIKDDWSAKTDILPACGILVSHLSDVDGWDVRDEVYDAVDSELKAQNCWSPIQLQRIFCFIALSRMQLCETSVADFLRESPAAVYRRATEGMRLQSDSSSSDLVDSCRTAAITRLAAR
jgi:energy-coupling factor transporter ATP-binding protein EcfA2